MLVVGGCATIIIIIIIIIIITIFSSVNQMIQCYRLVQRMFMVS
jgi:hypothetical protein